ncbi:MAG TPA: M56 family metallopeptidase [Bryobacteraceae bacterium]|nr:M56 family metallopeptidase [Bryobacteraceae bacterium]
MNPTCLGPIGDHLWQSTLFAGAAGLLTLTLRTNRARVRYWLWLTASCKFLVPLSLLVALGGQIAWRTAPPKVRPESSMAMEKVSQPFTASALPVLSPPSPPVARPSLPTLLAVIWACGFAGLALSWWIRWRRIFATVRRARPVPLALPIPVRSSATLGEPGVFGIFRPVLWLPDGIFERLTPAQLQAVIAHELCHFRYRDNLTAAIQMSVETVFWFHPLVWWIGKRMVAARERACDEEVLRLGSARQVYAEGILNVCKLYVESPLVCVPGATGANLKRRIEAILAERPVLRVNLAKRVMLGAAAVAAVALPIAIGVIHEPMIRAQSQAGSDWQAAAGGKMAFEVASVKLDNGPFRPPNFPLDNGNAFTPGDRFSADFPLLTYIQFAYKFHFSRQQRESMMEHSHLPKWFGSDRYAIEAKAASRATKDQMRLMMESLLAERFHLAVHFETQDTPVMALMLAKPGKTGPKLRPHSEGPACEDPAVPAPRRAAADAAGPFPERCYVQELSMNGHHLHAGSRNTTMDQLAEALSGLGRLDRPVVDQTGLSGGIDYEMQWMQEPNPTAPGEPATPSEPEPTFLQALREQLGLKLEPARAALRVLVIDHIERPSEN